MKLLETVPQDIKSSHDFKPCAPGIFRWIVVGGYLLVILSLVVVALAGAHEVKIKQESKAADEKLEGVRSQVNAIKSQSGQTQQVKRKYETAQQWLKGNYAMGRFLAAIYSSLPKGVRLQEMSVKEAGSRAGEFDLVMKFFAKSDGMAPEIESLAEKIESQGITLAERQQSVSDAGKAQMVARATMPQDFFPQGGGATPATVASPSSRITPPSMSTPAPRPSGTLGAKGKEQ